MGACPKALLFNFLQYDKNMADIQTIEAQNNINASMGQCVLLIQTAANRYK